MQSERQYSAMDHDWSSIPRHAEHISALESMEAHPPGNEPVLQAYSRAALTALHKGARQLTDYQDQLATFLAERTDITAESAQQLEWRVRQHYIGQRIQNYPTGFNDEKRWYEVIDHTSRSGSLAASETAHQLSQLTVQTNQPNRAAGVLLAATLFQDRYPTDGARIIDFGSSIDLILAQLKFNLLPPHVPEVADHTVEGDKLDPGIKRAITALFTGRLAVGESWGIDLVDSDQRTSGWVIPGCLYPSEYGTFLKPDALPELKKLLAMPYRQFRNNGLYHEQADFTSRHDMDKFADIVGDWHADIGTSQTTFYLNSASRQQRTKLRNALKMHRELLVPKQGVEIRQEHAVPKPNNPDDFTFTTVYGEQAHYNLLVRDLAEPEKGYQRYAEFSNGRLDVCIIARPLIDRLYKTKAL